MSSLPSPATISPRTNLQPEPECHLLDKHEVSKRFLTGGAVTVEPFVTADEIAVHLKITRRHVLEMTRRGLIPAHPLGVGECRRVWRYKISEVENAIA